MKFLQYFQIILLPNFTGFCFEGFVVEVQKLLKENALGV